MSVVVCTDIGSTYTKALAVDTGTGVPLAAAQHPTTIGSDVLDGYDACLAALADAAPGTRPNEQLVCSSAGGGLRLAVVGHQPLVSAEAGQAVGLSAGARVVHACGGRLDAAGLAALRAAAPDVILLVGGTDGGEADTITHNAARLAGGRLRVPVVVAGNADAAEPVAAVLAAARVPVETAGNVLPRIGQLAPESARDAIRAVFLRHVIGGKKLSAGPRLARLVRAATPDAVRVGVDVLAASAGEVVVVDVGGATTDVYSVLNPDTSRAPAAGMLWRARTVEGDLGVRWNAPGIVAAARTERLVSDAETGALSAAADQRSADPGMLPADSGTDRRLAALAVTVALRRHARGARRADGSRGPGRDLRTVRLVVGSGGVLRHARPAHAAAVMSAALTDHAGGYPLPVAATTVVDSRYLLAAAGLLATDHPQAAAQLVGHLTSTVAR